MKYIHISYSCCSEHGETEVTYYDTLEEAKKYAVKGDTIAQLVEKIV